MIINQYLDKDNNTQTPIVDETFARWGIAPLPWYAKTSRNGNNIVYWYENLSEADKAEMLTLDENRFRVMEGPSLSFHSVSWK